MAESMNWNCSTCQTVNVDSDVFCVACAAARVPKPSAEPIVPVVPLITSSPVPPGQHPTANSSNQPAPTTTMPIVALGPPPPTKNNPWLIGAVVTLLVVLVMGIAVLVARNNTSAPTSAPSSSERRPDRRGQDDEPSSTIAESSLPTNVPTISLPETSVPAATNIIPTAPPVGPDAASYPMLDTELPDRWITMLYSLPKGEYTLAQADGEAAAIARSQNIDQRVRLLDSDQSEHMNPGYWAIVVIGFDTRAEAIAMCDTFGIRRGDCYPRQPITGET